MKPYQVRMWFGSTMITAALMACGRGSGRPLAERNGVRVQAGYAHPSAGDAAAAYFRIANTGGGTDTLRTVTGPGVGNAMVMGTSGGHMTTLGPLILAAGSTVAMAPGSVHVMFGGLTHDWAIGDTIHLTLRFARAGDLEVAVPVLPFGEIP